MKHAMTVCIGDNGGVSRDKPDVNAWLKAGMGDYTGDQLRGAFATVRDSEHWKNDIDAVADAEMRDILSYAVPFMTGGDVFFDDLPDGKIRVTAPGYWSNGMDG